MSKADIHTHAYEPKYQQTNKQQCYVMLNGRLTCGCVWHAGTPSNSEHLRIQCAQYIRYDPSVHLSLRCPSVCETFSQSHGGDANVQCALLPCSVRSDQGNVFTPGKLHPAYCIYISLQ